MNTIAGFSIMSIGVGISLSEYGTTRGCVLEKMGLHYELHANGTNPEGERDEVMQAI